MRKRFQLVVPLALPLAPPPQRPSDRQSEVTMYRAPIEPKCLHEALPHSACTSWTVAVKREMGRKKKRGPLPSGNPKKKPLQL